MSRYAHPQDPQEEHEDERVSRPSRYRSLRKQTVSAPAPPNSRRTTSGNREADQHQQNDNIAASSISRSMSRYRRRAASVAGGMDNDAAQTMNSAAVTPPVPALPPLLKTASPPDVTGGQTELMRESSAPHRLRHTPQRRTIGQAIDDRDTHTNAVYEAGRDQITESNRDMRLQSPEQRDVSWKAERDRLLEEQKAKDLQRLEEELEKSQRARAQSNKFRSPVVDKFMFLSKGSKNSKDGMPPESPTTTSAGPSTRSSGQELARTQPTHIEPGGKGIVPQKDAPTSAINAGERNVAVRCRHNTCSLPITPETTTVDIIAQISNRMGYDIDMSSGKCLVIEQYGVLGLERRLRRYERIRDVMNSWDSDEQNRLAVTFSDPNDKHEDLDVSAIINREEGTLGCQLHMYHSNRPGKWNKRWITLLESGQIICAKKPNAKSTDKDAASLCHLSDYDIYTPTESQMRRHIKPPKRFCYAIKSQHKTTIFLNTENYVQYFSTDDPQVAHEFKQKAHGWRSWYLVDRNPEACKNQSSAVTKLEEKPHVQSALTKPTAKHPENVASVDGHRLRVSTDESPYVIGQFEPLLDMKRFDKRLSQFGKDFLPPESEILKQKPNQSVSRRLSKRERPEYKPPQPTRRESEDGFTGGLLGEEYDNRKQALAELEKKKKHPPELAFAERPSLPNSQEDPELSIAQPESPSWFPSALEHTAKQRAIPPSTVVRPTTSAGAGRRLSLTATSHPPSGLASSTLRPSTQYRSQHPHPQPHPNPVGSQPTTLPNLDRRVPPKPLVDLTPKTHEPPQWSKEKKGHGVRPPDDITHLVDFISPGNGIDGRLNDQPQPPTRTVPRRPTTSGSVGRSRTMTSASPRRPLFDDAPPVPSLPSRHAPESDGRVDRRETVKHKEREQEKTRFRERERAQREREYREREAAYNAVPGRTGTLKVV
ncbi:hypothetical protein F5Y09DRAFT_258030 [Xylaria sp. FL1042]|nr:hypothetical protein F5Y09DRAFT_258030 [Xylaria sp. FL1042]